MGIKYLPLGRESSAMKKIRSMLLSICYCLMLAVFIITPVAGQAPVLPVRAQEGQPQPGKPPVVDPTPAPQVAQSGLHRVAATVSHNPDSVNSQTTYVTTSKAWTGDYYLRTYPKNKLS